jgi:hypothetical protein
MESNLNGQRSLRRFKEFLECNLNLNPQMLSPKNPNVSSHPSFPPKADARDPLLQACCFRLGREMNALFRGGELR